MKKLTAYKTAKKEFDVVSEEVVSLENQLDDIKRIEVSSSLCIDKNSSESQFIYAIGIINQQIATCKELGIDTTPREEMKKACIHIRNLVKEHKAWDDYENELCTYTNQVYKLLTEEEKFSLLNYPKKK